MIFDLRDLLEALTDTAVNDMSKTTRSLIIIKCCSHLVLIVSDCLHNFLFDLEILQDLIHVVPIVVSSVSLLVLSHCQAGAPQLHLAINEVNIGVLEGEGKGDAFDYTKDDLKPGKMLHLRRFHRRL